MQFENMQVHLEWNIYYITELQNAEEMQYLNEWNLSWQKIALN